MGVAISKKRLRAAPLVLVGEPLVEFDRELKVGKLRITVRERGQVQLANLKRSVGNFRFHIDFCCGRLIEIPGADDHMGAVAGQLAYGFEAEPSVAAGYHRDLA